MRFMFDYYFMIPLFTFMIITCLQMFLKIDDFTHVLQRSLQVSQIISKISYFLCIPLRQTGIFSSVSISGFHCKSENVCYTSKLLVSVIIIIIGFLLMSGGESKNPEIFSNEIYNFRRIRLAPLVVILGFTICIITILKKSKN